MTGASRVFDRPRLRLAALTGLLALALVLSAVLAWRAVASERSRRLAAERSLVDYADFAAFVLATGVYREFGIRILATFAALPPWRTPQLFEGAGADLGCGDDGVYFEYEPAGRTLRHRANGFSPESNRRLRDTLAYSVTLFNEASWRFRYVRIPLGEAGTGVFLSATTTPDGLGVRGLSTCLWSDSTFVGLMQREAALPPSLTGQTPAESLYAVSVHDDEGVTFYQSPVRYAGGFTGSSALGPEFGDLALSVTLNPQRAPALLIGGTPSSNVLSALGLFVLSAVLLLAAVTQLRREYRLIADRSDFVSGVSHELRTPLSQILIFTDLLKLDRLRSEEERSRALDIIDKETRRLIRLVENVLQFSRASSTPMSPMDAVELAPFIRESVDAFRPLAEERGARLCPDVPPDAAVRADRHALRQVLVNLLDNAVKYGPRGQTVRIETVTNGRDVEIAVEDQGPGVHVDDRDRVWNGFQRLERQAASVPGSGIGLSVVKTLVERMGGRVTVGDSATGGARFTVILPSSSPDGA